MEAIDKILQFIDGSSAEKSLSKQTLQTLTSGPTPLIPDSFYQTHHTIPLIQSITKDELASLEPEQKLLLTKLALKKRDLQDTFAKNDTKDRNAINIQTHPIYFAINKLKDGSPALYKFLIELLLWNRKFQTQLIQKRLQELIKEVFENDHEITSILSNAIDSRESGISSLLSKALLVRNTIVNSRTNLDEIDSQIGDTITYLIDTAIQATSTNYQPKHSFLKLIDSDKDLPEDRPITLTLSHSKPTLLESTDEDISESFNIATLPASHEDKSNYYRRSYAKQTQYKTAKKAQFLDNAVEALTDTEFEELITEVTIQISSEDPTKQADAFLIGFSLATGSEPGFWWDWKITNQKSSNANEFGIDLEQGVWFKPILRNLRYWKPKEDQKELVETVSDQNLIPIPEVLLRFIRENINPELSLGSSLTVQKEDAIQICDAWLLKHLAFNRRITIAKVRNTVYWKMMQRHFDESAASHVTAQPILQTPESNNYSTFTHSELVTMYQSIFDGLFTFSFKPSSDFLVGSKLCIKKNHIKATFENLKQKGLNTLDAFNESNSLSNLIELHNSLVSYCILQGLFNTGHRPHIDPFARMSDFIEEINSVLISDKIVSDTHKTRLSFYSDTFKSQIINYTRHLNALAENLAGFNFPNEAFLFSDLTNPITEKNIPLFFYLIVNEKKELDTISISESSLKKFIPNFRIPFNAGRHFLATELRKQNLTPEYINYQLGHKNIGEEPYSQYSVLSPEIVSKQIVPCLNKIFDEFNITPIFGLQNSEDRKHKQIELPKVIKTERRLGPIKRIDEFNSAKQLNRALVREAMTNYISSQDSEFFRQNHQVLIDQACTYILNNAKSQIIIHLSLFLGLVKRHSKKISVITRTPRALYEISAEPGPFDYIQFPLWHKLKLLKKHFIKHLENLDYKTLTKKETHPLFYLSLMIFSKYTNKARLSKVEQALFKQQYLIDKDQAYIEISTREAQIERIALDPLSTLLLFQIEKMATTDLKEPLPFHNIKRSISGILSKMPPNSKLNYKELVTAIQFDAALYMPGIIAANQSGQRLTASLNQDSYIRVCKRVKPNSGIRSQKSQSSSINLGVTEKINLILQRNSPTNLKKAKNSLKEIRVVLQNEKNEDKDSEKIVKTDPKTQLAVVTKPKRLRLERKELTSKLLTNLNRLTENPEIPQNLILLATWAIERLNTPGEKKETLKFSTTLKYFNYLALSILEEFDNLNLLELSEDDLLEHYNHIIAGYHSNTQDIVAAQIINFHNEVCSKHFGIEPFEKSELTYESSNEEQAINANFITPDELEKIQERLEQTEHSSHLIQQQRELINILSAKFGMRPREIYQLEMSDIFKSKIGMKRDITIRANRLGDLKTPQSARYLKFAERLTELEQEQLDNFLNTRSAIDGHQLWVSDLEQSGLSPNFFKNDLLNIMRTTLGDFRLQTHSLRHSTATIEFLAYFDHILISSGKTSKLNQLFHLDSWFNSNVENTIEQLFASKTPSRRFSYHTAQVLGHAAPNTTLTNYSHFYELVTPHFYNDFDYISNKVISKLNPKFNSTNLRTIRSRIKSNTKLQSENIDKLVLEHVLTHTLKTTENVTDKIKKFKANQPENIGDLAKSRKHSNLGIIQLYNLLNLINLPEPNYEQIQYRFSVTKNEIEQLRSLYKALACETAINPLTIDLSLSQSSSKAKMGYTNTHFKTTFNTANLINKHIINNDSAFFELIDLWIKYIDPNRTFWFFETDDQKLTVKRLLTSTLNMDEEKIVLTSRVQQSEELRKLDNDNFRYRYAKYAEATPISNLLHPSLLEKVNGLAILNKNVIQKTHYLNQEYNTLFFLAKLLSQFNSQLNSSES